MHRRIINCFIVVIWSESIVHGDAFFLKHGCLFHAHFGFKEMEVLVLGMDNLKVILLRLMAQKWSSSDANSNVSTFNCL